MNSASLVVPAALLLGALPVRADLLTGVVTDSTGAGVPNVNIDAVDAFSGNPVDVPINTTGANGSFSLQMPAGVYDVTFKPPSPPTTTHLPLLLGGQVVFGTTNLGNVALAPGVAVSGRVVGPSGQPVQGVDIDIVDESTGLKIVLTQDDTNAQGLFAVPAPPGPVTVEFDATGIAFPVLASNQVALVLAGDVNLGDVPLQPGFVLSGAVKGPGGAPVPGADIDVRDQATGEKLLTPKDDTNGAGLFSVVVPAGLYRVEACAPFAAKLATEELQNVLVNGHGSLGTIFLSSGVVLSGTVTSFAGQPVSGADLDLFDPATGALVPTCADNSGPLGSYAAVAPPGTWKAVFSPPGFDQPLGADVHPSVAVFSDTLLNAVLPACPFAQPYGVGAAGSGGLVPVLSSSGGAPRVGNDAWAYELSNAVGGTVAFLALNVSPGSLPLGGGTILVAQDNFLVLLPVTLGGAPGAPGAGSLSFPFPVPITEVFSGLTVYAQYIAVDVGAPPFFFSISQGLSAGFCP